MESRRNKNLDLSRKVQFENTQNSAAVTKDYAAVSRYLSRYTAGGQPSGFAV